ncbi:MAG: hypothetical protein ETSY1_46310 (plasmid) [Candidatus Entotheonella factor]|uniref:ABC transporter n=1 Tax=Entotheonella factor TaxID=1429438 RepID=W4M192_ENTF1|nr:MAG: hypothetical protein ETSY1_46310 [Candidatus Entotheonella factor]
MARSSLWRSVPVIPQMEMAECGAACLAMVLAFFGKYVSLTDLRRACGVSRDGVTAWGLHRAARTYGLEVQVLKTTLDALIELPLPAIVHWGFNHFVVLESCRRSGAIIVDPAVGRRWVPQEELNDVYTGIVLTFKPTTHFQPSSRPRHGLLQYLAVLRHSPSSVLMVLGATFAAEILGLVFPALNQFLIDHVIQPQRSAWFWPLVTILGVSLVARLLLLLIRDRLLAVLHFTVDVTLTTHFVRHLSRLPTDFFLHRSPGDLLQRVAANQTLRDLASQFLAAALDGVLVISYALLLLAYDLTLGTLTLGLALLRLGVTSILRRPLQYASATELALRGKELGASVEAVAAPETARAFGITSTLLDRYTNRLHERLNASIVLKRSIATNQRVAQLVDGIALSATLWLGGYAVMMDQMTLGVFAGFITLQGLLRAPLGSIVQAYIQWGYARGILARLDDVLQSRVEAEGGKVVDQLTGAVSLNHLSFRYGPEAPWVLEDVHLHLNPGEMVSIVGPSGAGKSTLLHVLLGFLEPTTGTVDIDGIAMADLDRRALRRQIGSLVQAPGFFNDTVRANLSLYNDAVPMQVLEEAAKRACIHETIQALPNGYDTRLGEHASRLSGGQRQRLALARALVGQPGVMVLDEPTSALDPETETQVLQHLRQMPCTCLWITHRLETTRFADRIVVLDQGQVVQQGTFETLSQRPGLFNEMLRTGNDDDHLN